MLHLEQMPRRNRLNSVAHNLPAWFDSSMNFVGGGPYANGLDFLAGKVEALGGKRIEIDVLAKYLAAVS